MKIIRDIMTENPYRIHKDKLICEVATALASKQISGAPLVDNDDRMVGVIAHADITQFESVGGDPYVTMAWEICRKATTIAPTATIKEGAQMMMDRRVRGLIVVDAQDEPIGVVTTYDFTCYVAQS